MRGELEYIDPISGDAVDMNEISYDIDMHLYGTLRAKVHGEPMRRAMNPSYVAMEGHPSFHRAVTRSAPWFPSTRGSEFSKVLAKAYPTHCQSRTYSVVVGAIVRRDQAFWAVMKQHVACMLLGNYSHVHPRFRLAIHLRQQLYDLVWNHDNVLCYWLYAAWWVFVFATREHLRHLFDVMPTFRRHVDRMLDMDAFSYVVADCCNTFRVFFAYHLDENANGDRALLRRDMWPMYEAKGRRLQDLYDTDAALTLVAKRIREAASRAKKGVHSSSAQRRVSSPDTRPVTIDGVLSLVKAHILIVRSNQTNEEHAPSPLDKATLADVHRMQAMIRKEKRLCDTPLSDAIAAMARELHKLYLRVNYRRQTPPLEDKIQSKRKSIPTKIPRWLGSCTAVDSVSKVPVDVYTQIVRIVEHMPLFAPHKIREFTKFLPAFALDSSVANDRMQEAIVYIKYIYDSYTVHRCGKDPLNNKLKYLQKTYPWAFCLLHAFIKASQQKHRVRTLRLPKHCIVNAMRGVKHMLGLRNTASEIIDDVVSLLYCPCCLRVYNVYVPSDPTIRALTRLKSMRYGYKSVVLDYDTEEMFCVKDKTRNCGTVPLERISLVSNAVVIDNQYLYMLCSQPRCGAIMEADSSTLYTNAYGACCSLCKSKKAIASSSTDALVGPDGEWTQATLRCVCCHRKIQDPSNAFYYDGVVLCRVHGNNKKFKRFYLANSKRAMKIKNPATRVATMHCDWKDETRKREETKRAVMKQHYQYGAPICRKNQ